MGDVDTGTLNLFFTDGSKREFTDFQYYTMQGPFIVIAMNSGEVNHFNEAQISGFTYTPKETN